MPQVTLNHPRIHSRFQQVGSIAVPEGMHGDSAFIDASIEFGPSEGSLETVENYVLLGSGGFVAASTQGRKNEDGIAVGDPISAEQIVGFPGKGNISIFSTLASMNMESKSDLFEHEEAMTWQSSRKTRIRQ